ncbi:MAG: adenylate/guanylate cyclase domain-containing protein, partial [Chloroflexota bacterium]
MSTTLTEGLETIKQLQTLNAYVAPAVGKQALHNPDRQPGGSSRRFKAATAFADISGFTPLAEELALNGSRGTEELTAILNEVFADLIQAAERQGGEMEVVKFGGDALSLIWPYEDKDIESNSDNQRAAVLRAVQAAFAMQAAMARFSTIKSGQGEFSLHMKVGISVGELLEVHAGGVYSRWEYVLAGAPMANMSSAENHAQADEIVVDQSAWDVLQGQLLSEKEIPPLIPQNKIKQGALVVGQAVSSGFYRVVQMCQQAPDALLATPDWSILDPKDIDKVSTTLKNYIPGAIKSLLDQNRTKMLAELKPMTVCFVGFEGIDYDHDPEAGKRLAEFTRDAQEMVYHYEGSVNKLAIGDKGSVLLILFGAPPFFHEDDEIRGIACALALRNVAERYQLQLRVGLAAGPLFAGPVGPPQRREYTVVGDTVNLAARLMQKAGFGEVWLDHPVQAQAVDVFEFQDLGRVPIKGKTEPRQIYQALGEKEQDQEEKVMSYLLSDQELTGREDVIAQVDKLADQVWDNKGQILLLSGEAGVGKSRLAGEIVRRWLTRGGVSHSGDCVSYGKQTPYLPWRSVVSALAGLSPRLSPVERLHRLETLLRQLPQPEAAENVPDQDDYWLERLPLLAEILGLEAPETRLTQNLTNGLRRDNIFAVIRTVLLHESRKRPLLIMIEDTHWSDELSLSLAAEMAVSLQDHAIFLVLVHRPLSEPIPLDHQRIQNLPNTSDIMVTELGVEASLKLVRSKLGVKQLPDNLAELISSKGQGNPFFIEELVNSLLGMGVLKIEAGVCCSQSYHRCFRCCHRSLQWRHRLPRNRHLPKPDSRPR